MAIHQYIGARYVPIYYQNSLDPTSTEWEPNVSYEALTIVTLPNLHSYISKKYVPDTIGTPASNADYWLDQGYANAYIQALQDQIDDINDGNVSGSLQNQIDTLVISDNSKMLKRRYLIIGDSYNFVTVNGWDDVCESLMNLTSDDYYNLSASGYGFSRAGYKFLAYLTANYSNIPNPDTFTDIVVCAGANDVGYSDATIRTDISDFKDYCESNFPNATLRIGFVSWSNDRTTAGSLRNAFYSYLGACASLGIPYLRGVECAMHDFTYFNNIDYPDGLHPSQDGNNAIGGAVAQALLQGNANIHRKELAGFIPNTSAISTSMQYLFTAEIINDQMQVSTYNIEVTSLASHNAGESIQIGTYTNDLFKANTSIPIISLNGYTDYLLLNWNGTANIYLTHSVSANQTLSYYFAPPSVFPIMST